MANCNRDLYVRRMTSPTYKGRVAVGMSGGIDSSVAAALLVEQGWEVIGLSLHMFKEGSRCCSIEDVNRARRVCDRLGLRHYVMNVVDDFKDAIVKPFTDAYASGRTPNPCIYCNRDFKFGALLRRAEQLGCSHVATGHYVRIEQRPDGYHLLRGLDRSKDQSYFLHRLTQAQLARCRFPLGDITKTEVRAIAAAKQIPVEGMRETADLCFITAAGPAPLIEQFHPEAARTGDIVDTAGKKLGTHRGLHHFTVGQREGLRVATGRPMYVKSLEPETNTVVIAPRDGVLTKACHLREFFWQTPTPPTAPAKLSSRIRYRSPAVAATLTQRDGNWHLEFDEPQFAVAPGQAAVLFEGDEILGGGWIENISQSKTDLSAA
jgi:tRNA-uridine 2-sulfurtransferase